MRSFFISILILFSVLNLNAQYEEQTIFSSGVNNDFGSAAATNGTYHFIGAISDETNGTYSGAVYIHEKNGFEWLSTKIIPDDNQAQDRFGCDIAADGNRAVIGAWGNSDESYFGGSAYFYKFNGTDWVKHQKVHPSDPGSEDYFGSKVEISGNRAIISAYYKNSYTGAVYVFEYDEGTDSWNEVQKITASDELVEAFGYDISVFGDYLAIGAPGSHDSEGEVYIFKHNGTEYTEQEIIRLPASKTDGTTFFGQELCLYEEKLIVGAPSQTSDYTDQGVAYAFEFDGTSWNQTQTITPFDATGEDFFSQTIEINNGNLFFSSPGNNTRRGAIHHYTHDGTNWVHEQKITGSELDTEARFGRSIAAYDNILIGASPGDNTAYFFAKDYVEQTHFYITPDGAGNQDGTSWENAIAGAQDQNSDGYADLQDIINLAPEGSEIWVAQGIYKPTTSAFDMGKSFSLKNGITLYGGFAGHETELEERNPETNKTIFSGDLDNNDETDADGICQSYNGITGTNSRHLFFNQQVDETAIIDGFYFTSAFAQSDYPGNYGAAIFNNGNALDITGNFANPKIKNCFFIGNKALGGIVYNTGNNGGQSNPYMFNCYFSGNYSGSSAILVFSADGGTSHSLTEYCIFENNTGDYGGAIRTHFLNTNQGDGSASILNCVFKSNTASYGGAVFIDGGNGYNNSYFENCLFSGNYADAGGAVYSAGDYGTCIPTFMNCTFAGNMDDTQSNPASVLFNYYANPVLINSVIWGNAPTIMHNFNASPEFEHCIVQGSGGSSQWNADYGTDNGNNLDAAPGFYNLPDYTLAPTSEGDFHIYCNSPAKNAGTLTDAPQYDLEDNPRTDEPDLGAYECSGTNASYEILKKSLEVAPNPTSNFIEFNIPGQKASAEIQIQITDMNGKIIRNESRKADNSKIKLSGQAPGVYILKVQMNGNIFTGKIIKK